MSGTVQTQTSYLPTDYFSGGLSISGLGNGTDFGTMIDQLRKIELMPTQRMLRWKSEWRERQEAFKIVREQLVSLRDVCSKMNTMDKFLVKKASSSDPTKATATADSSAIENSYKLEVQQTASTSIWSLQNEFYDGKANVNPTTDTKEFSYEYAGSVRTIKVPPNTTVESLKNMINNDTGNPGVRASLIKSANGVTFQIKGMDQGAKNDLSIINTGGLTGFPGAGSYTSHQIAYTTQFTSASDKINDSDDKTFTFTYGDAKHSINVPQNMTLQEFVDSVNSQASTTGVSATLSVNEGGYQVVSFSGADDGKAVQLPTSKTWEKFGKPTTIVDPRHTFNTSYTGLDSVVNSGADTTFTYFYDGVPKNVAVPSGMKLDEFIKAINADLPEGMNPATATLKGGTYQISFSGEKSFTAVPPTLEMMTAMGSPVTSGGDPAGWHIQHSQNALVRVDGWPVGDWLEVESNTVRDVVEGVTFTLIGEGVSTISVNTDAEAIQENVIGFIDAVNQFRKTISDLTKYDENKETYDLKYAESLYEMQKGSILTGNYGIQLLSSQVKQATAGAPQGFMPRYEVDGVFFGDLFTSLSQIGIKTNASGNGGETFGMLELNEDPKLPVLTDVLRDNPEAVAEFFASVNKGVSDSPNFSFSSSLHNITRPGSYGVDYTISTNSVTGEKEVVGTINGKPAKWYPESNEFGLVRQSPTSSDKDAVTVSSDGTTAFDMEIEVANEAKAAQAVFNFGSTSQAAGKGTISYSLNGKTPLTTVEFNENESLDMVAAKINRLGDPAVKASVKKNDDDTFSLVVESRQTGKDQEFTTAPSITYTSNDPLVTPPAAPTPASVDKGEDAKYKVDGGDWKYSATNTLTGLKPGVIVTLKGATSGTPAELSGEKNNDADGIIIQIDNLADGTYGGQTRIKQGKIPELLDLLNGLPGKSEEGMLGTKGSIQLLLDNYDKIVEGIDKKISKETERISKWERTTKLRFSRLEATLKQYDSLSKMIDSQVKQLGSNTSKK